MNMELSMKSMTYSVAIRTLGTNTDVLKYELESLAY